MSIKLDAPDGFGTVRSLGDKWVAFDVGDTEVQLNGRFTLQELKEILSEVESHLAPSAANGALPHPALQTVKEIDHAER